MKPRYLGAKAGWQVQCQQHLQSKFKGSLSNLARTCLKITKAKGERHSVQPSPGVHFPTQGSGEVPCSVPQRTGEQSTRHARAPKQTSTRTQQGPILSMPLRMQSSHFQWLCKEVTHSKAGTEHTRTENLPRTKQTMEQTECLFITSTSLDLHT